jgi:methylmalonyl-CoA mutase N-terminal domain/subunit
LSFFFNAHNNLFEEVAKLRAARRLWAAMMKDRGATDAQAQMLRFHTQTAGSTLTAAQPVNNITRVAVQALAAVLGGTQSLHTNGYDEALSLPTEEAAKTALRTQQILAFESGVADTADPLAGSFYVESLTDELAARASELIGRITEMGGAVSAIEQGFMQEEIGASAWRFQQEVESGDRIIVGVNAFVDEAAETPERLRVDEGIREKQTARLRELRERRDNEAVGRLRAQLGVRAMTGENLMPLVVELAEKKATLGEIADTLRTAWGEYRG